MFIYSWQKKRNNPSSATSDFPSFFIRFATRIFFFVFEDTCNVIELMHFLKFLTLLGSMIFMHGLKSTISAFLKNCQNGTFLPMHENQKFFGPNHLIWSAMKVQFCDFIQNVPQAPSMCIPMWIKVNKWNYLKNPS